MVVTAHCESSKANPSPLLPRNMTKASVVPEPHEKLLTWNCLMFSTFFIVRALILESQGLQMLHSMYNTNIASGPPFIAFCAFFLLNLHPFCSFGRVEPYYYCNKEQCFD